MPDRCINRDSAESCNIAKALLFPSAMEALGGNLANGLTTEVWWSRNHPYKSSLTGETAKQLCDAWTKRQKTVDPAHRSNVWGYEMADVIKRAETLNRTRSVRRWPRPT
jgi:branched-chain amino acid transport system substrate-binding protein